jgi:hypothetical protein
MGCSKIVRTKVSVCQVAQGEEEFILGPERRPISPF